MYSLYCGAGQRGQCIRAAAAAALTPAQRLRGAFGRGATPTIASTLHVRLKDAVQLLKKSSHLWRAARHSSVRHRMIKTGCPISTAGYGLGHVLRRAHHVKGAPWMQS